MSVAEVLAFPRPETRPASCLICRLVAPGPITWCTVVDQQIVDDKRTAETCPDYDEDPEAY